MKTGLRIQLYDPDGLSFQCAYNLEEHSPGEVFKIAERLAARQKRHYILSIEPCSPPPPMTMEQWIAAGHTTD